MRLLGAPVGRQRVQAIPASIADDLPIQALGGGGYFAPATDVTLPVVYACIHIITQRLCAMPVRLLDRRGQEVTPLPPWLRRPSEGFTGPDLISQLAVSLITRGNAYVLVNRAPPPAMLTREVYVVNPDDVNIDTHGQGPGGVAYRISGQVYDGEVLHLRNITQPGSVYGLSPIDAARKVTQIGQASKDLMQRHFRQSAHLQMALVVRSGVSAEEKRSLVAQLRAAHMGGAEKAWAPLVLDGDVDVRPLSMTAEQAQFVQLSGMTNAEIAGMIYRVDPSLLGIVQQGAQLTYSNLVDREAQLLRDAVRPLARRIEDGLTRLAPVGYTVELDARELLRGAPRDRAQLATSMASIGAFTRDEVREVLGYTPLADDADCLTGPPPPETTPPPPVGQVPSSQP